MAGRKTTKQPTSWSVVEAKAHLDEVIDEAEDAGPQRLVKNGDQLGVLVPTEAWVDKRRRKGTLVEFLDNSPLPGLDVDFERHPDTQEREIHW